MKKIVTLLLLLCMVCTGAWAVTIEDGIGIRLKNSSHNFYLSIYSSSTRMLTGTTTATDANTWKLVAATGGYKLYNVSERRYASPIASRNGGILTTTDESSAGIYAFEVNGSYYNLKCMNGSDTGYSYFHGVDWTNQGVGQPYYRVVDWSADATASKWILENVQLPREFPEENTAYYIKRANGSTYINLVSSDTKGTIWGSEPENIYFVKVSGGFNIKDSEGNYMGKHSKSDNTWNMSSSIPEVWTVETVSGGYALKSATGGHDGYLGFDSDNVGEAGYRDKSYTTQNNSGVFTITEAPSAPSTQTYTIHILGLPSTENITVMYGGEAKGDGSEVVGASLAPSAFTNATTVAGYTPTITVSGTNVNVKYQRDDVFYDSTTEYTTNDVRFQRAITSITLGSSTKNIAEYDPITSGTSFKAYRDLTESVIFTVEANQANLTLAVGVPGGTSDHVSWTGAYFYLSNAQSTPFAQIVPNNGLFEYASTIFTAPSEAGRYRVRIVHSASSADNAYSGTSNFTAGTGNRIVDFTLVVEDKDWDAYNTKLTFLKQVELGTELGQYTCVVNGQEVNASALSMYREAWQDSYDGHDNSYYDNNMNEMDTYIAGMSLNMPETGKFYRLKSVAGNHYLSNNCSNNGNTAITMDGDENTSIFYLDENMGLLAYADGKYVRNPWRTGVKGTTVPGHDDEPYDAAWSFAEGQLGKYVIIYPGGYLLVGNGSNASYAVNTEINKKVDNNQWVIEEVTSLPIGMNQNTAGENPDRAFYGSIYLPTTMTVPDGTQAYIATYQPTENLLHMELVGNEGDVIPEGAYILRKADETVSSIIVGAEVNTTPEHTNVLTGTIFAGQAFDTTLRYALSGKNGIGFYKYNPATYPVAKAVYIPAEPTALAAFYFDFGDPIVTAIQELQKENQENGTIFDLQGRRIQKAQKGMNIINGRKVLR